MTLTLDDFPPWSIWLRDYSCIGGADHWVMFVVEYHDLPDVACRVLATAVPDGAPVGTFKPGRFFFVEPCSAFASLVKRLA